jgi:hypothetical protein
MTLTERLTSWYLSRRLRKALGLNRAQWKELIMTPFPKWVGWLGAIVAAVPALYAAYQTGGIKGLIMAIIALVGSGTVLNSHSATGTGGTPSNP